MATAPRWSVPRGAWVLLPLVAALLYAGLVSWARRSPRLRDLVPQDAVEVQRYRDLAALDEAVPAPGAPVSERVGARLNLPGLPGIDRTRPLLVALVAPPESPASEVFVLPVSDGDAVERTFADPNLPQRHAGAVDVRGDHAVAGADRAVVRRRAAAGDLWPEERGEAWARLVDWPRFVDVAVERRREGAFRQALEAIGVDVDRIVAEPGAEPPAQVSFGRLPVVREAWSRAGLHAFPDRVLATLRPAAGGELARALADAARATAEPPPPAPPPYADGPALFVRGAAGRRVLALALRDAGVAFPPEASLASFRPDAPGSVALWAEPAAEGGFAVAIAGPPGAIPDLAAFGLPAPAETATPLPSRVLLAAPFGGDGPAGSILRASRPDGSLALVAFGPGAERAAAAASALGSPADAPAAEPGAAVLAWFRLPETFASRLLGPALEPGGLLAPLRGGAIEGTLSTDGARLLLDLRRR